MTESSTKIGTGGQRQVMARTRSSPFTAHCSTLTARVASRPRRRAFALYLLTISIGMLLTTTALTLIAMQRAERRLQENIARTNVLGSYARSGLEMAIAFTEQVSDWRTRAASSSGKLFEDFAIGDGKVTVQLFDDTDGQLNNRDSDYVRIRCTANQNAARLVLEGTLRPRPHPALRNAVFGSSANDMELMNGTAIRGPVRAHGLIRVNGCTLQDDVWFETMNSYAIENVAVALTSHTATPIALPQPSLTYYQSLASGVTGSGGAKCELHGCNLTPTTNTAGSINANGIYWLQAGNREVVIENLHVKGTLIITGVSGKVTIRDGLWLEPGPLQYPVLLIDSPGAQVEIRPDATISEVTLFFLVGLSAANLNGDADVLDVFNSQIRGIVWVNASRLFMRNTTWYFTGSTMSPAITVDNGVVLENDRTLLNTFSPGFVQSGMDLVTGSIREVWP